MIKNTLNLIVGFLVVATLAIMAPNYLAKTVDNSASIMEIN